MSNHEQIAVSVVIPAYNRAATIGYCLQSVLAQTCSPLEVIIVDDCSTDATADQIRGFNDPRIRYFCLERRSGAQAARNFGIRAAHGGWIAFQDSDDKWLPFKLERQLALLKTLNADPWTVIHTNAIFRETATGNEIPCDLAIEGDNVYPELLRRIGPMFQGMLVSVQALQLIGYLDEQVPSYQEWDTAIRLAQHCKFRFIPEPLFIYHLHLGETISKNQQLNYDGYRYVIYKFESEIKRLWGQTLWEEHLRALQTKVPS